MKLQSLILYFEKIEMYLGINIPVFLQDFLSFVKSTLLSFWANSTFLYFVILLQFHDGFSPSRNASPSVKLFLQLRNYDDVSFVYDDDENDLCQ